MPQQRQYSNLEAFANGLIPRPHITTKRRRSGSIGHMDPVGSMQEEDAAGITTKDVFCRPSEDLRLDALADALEIGNTQPQCSHAPSTNEPRTPPRKKLRPVPRHAPRNMEKKGRFTIRKGVRIREYKVPTRPSGPYLSPKSSPGFQCRDGFSEQEVRFGQPQVSEKRSRGEKGQGKENTWDSDLTSQRPPGCVQQPLSREN